MTDPRPAVPVLVNVNMQPDAVTFTGRLPSGHLTVQTIQRPAYLSPGQDLENPDALPCLTVWSKNPTVPRDAPLSGPPAVLASFEVDPDTAEGAAALAALGMKRWTQPRPRPPHSLN